MSSVLVRRRYACAYEEGPRAPALLLPGWASMLAPLAAPVTAYCGALGEAPLVALTYDDGPDPEYTPRVLDELAGAGMPATFFVLMEQAEQHPDVVRRMVAEGHEVGLHGVDHTRLSTLPLRDSLRRILAARRRLGAITQAPVRWYRPAYGGIRLTQLLALRARGLDVPVWTGWARDWEDESVATLAERAQRALHPGGVLLLHDAASGLPADAAGGIGSPPSFDRGELTARVACAVVAAGLRPVTLSQLKASQPAARVPWFERRRTAALRTAPG